MQPKNPEILQEKDVLGLNKPTGQMKHLKKRKGGTWFITMVIFVLLAGAAVLYYLQK